MTEEKRPTPVNHVHEKVGETQQMSDPNTLKTLSAHVIENHKKNNNIAACCRDLDNLSMDTYKTHPDLKAPNKIVMTCTCGKKHTRVGAGSDQNITG